MSRLTLGRLYAVRERVPGRIRAKRIEVNKTQAELAVRARCTQQHISWIETGRVKDVPVERAARIARALDTPVEWLFSDDRVSVTPTVSTGRRNRGRRAA